MRIYISSFGVCMITYLFLNFSAGSSDTTTSVSVAQSVWNYAQNLTKLPKWTDEFGDNNVCNHFELIQFLNENRTPGSSVNICERVAVFVQGAELIDIWCVIYTTQTVSPCLQMSQHLCHQQVQWWLRSSVVIPAQFHGLQIYLCNSIGGMAPFKMARKHPELKLWSLFLKQLKEDLEQLAWICVLHNTYHCYHCRYLSDVMSCI